MGLVLHHCLRAFLVGLIALFAGSPHRFAQIGLFHRAAFLDFIWLVGGLCPTAEAGLHDGGSGHYHDAYGQREKLAQQRECRPFCASRRHQSFDS